jgi:hypothetical protein
MKLFKGKRSSPSMKSESNFLTLLGADGNLIIVFKVEHRKWFGLCVDVDYKPLRMIDSSEAQYLLRLKLPQLTTTDSIFLLFDFGFIYGIKDLTITLIEGNSNHCIYYSEGCAEADCIEVVSEEEEDCDSHDSHNSTAINFFKKDLGDRTQYNIREL